MFIKFNWGTGIFTFIVIFIILMLGMVYFSFQQDNELVDESYYPKGMEYQQQIDRRLRTQKLPYTFDVQQTSNEVVITFPPDLMDMDFQKGEIYFYRPSARKFDIKENMKPEINLQQTFSLNRFRAGKYNVKLSWRMGDEEYYDEKTIIISK
ncbi:MAG: FixH family protein [Lentimicrobiaceae bacterium]|nr:FixH family protein [Lentimicrobiaceae bacterium]